jgi:hypothetical protein
MRMLRQHLLAMGVKFFGDDPDGLFLNVVGVGEWEGIENTCFPISRIISNS